MRIKNKPNGINSKAIVKPLLGLCLSSFLMLPPVYVNAASLNVNVNYKLSIAGFKLGSVGLAARLKNKNYAISIRAFTTGALDKIMRFTIETRARGRYVGPRINSTEYITAYSNKKLKRHVVVKYPDRTRASVNAKPAYPKFKDTVPLHAKHLRNVVDPLGAMLLPFNKQYKIDSKNQCKRSQAIFDGVTRYTLQMSSVGSNHSNDKMLKHAIICKIKYLPIAGHRKSQVDKTIIDNFSSATVWLYPVEKAGVLLPLKIEIPTQFGTFKILSNTLTIGSKKVSFK